MSELIGITNDSDDSVTLVLVSYEFEPPEPPPPPPTRPQLLAVQIPAKKAK